MIIDISNKNLNYVKLKLIIFLSLQELLEKVFEWFGFLLAAHLFPEPELFEHESESEAKSEIP